MTRSRPQRNNRSTGIAGITRYVNVDRRKSPPAKYVRYGVFYGSHGEKRVKHFEVGRVGTFTAEDEQRALRQDSGRTNQGRPARPRNRLTSIGETGEMETHYISLVAHTTIRRSRSLREQWLKCRIDADMLRAGHKRTNAVPAVLAEA